MKIKKTHNIYINYKTNAKQESDREAGLITGEMIQTTDNFCFGITSAKNNTSPSHIFLGTFIDGEGLIICRFNYKDLKESPCYFDGITTVECGLDKYNGIVSKASKYFLLPIGKASMEVTERSMLQSQIDCLINKFNEKLEIVANENELNKKIINHIINQDREEIAKMISINKQSQLKKLHSENIQ